MSMKFLIAASSSAGNQAATTGDASTGIDCYIIIIAICACIIDNPNSIKLTHAL